MSKQPERATREPVFMRIAIDKIDPGRNVRLDDDDALVDSIARWGVLQPITVVPSETDPTRVECMFGHRRLAAARKLGMETIPALGHQRSTEQMRILMQIAENRDRQEMTMLEEAFTFKQLRETGMSAEHIAKALNISTNTVHDKLKLLAYPGPVQRQVHLKRLTLNDALSIPIELARRTSDEELTAICRHGGWRVREWIREGSEREHIPRIRKASSALGCDADTADLIRSLAHGRGETVAAWLRRVAASEVAAA